MEIVVMTENCPITGVKYGTVEIIVPENEKLNKNLVNKVQQKKQQYALNIRRENTKHK